MAFADVRIDDGLVIYATTGGPRYSTTVVQTKAGFEKRNADWAFSLGKWDIGERQITNVDLRKLLAFFHARRGKFEGFRFKDFADDTADVTDSALRPTATAGLYQLYKNYGGTLRKITKPVAGSVRIFSQAGEIHGCSVDGLTGLVSVPEGAEPVAWAGQFDVPVRFDTDEFKHRFDHYDRKANLAVFYVSTLPVFEILE